MSYNVTAFSSKPVQHIGKHHYSICSWFKETNTNEITAIHKVCRDWTYPAFEPDKQYKPGAKYSLYLFEGTYTQCLNYIENLEKEFNQIA
jgi:hypothetical protein